MILFWVRWQRWLATVFFSVLWSCNSTWNNGWKMPELMPRQKAAS